MFLIRFIVIIIITIIIIIIIIIIIDSTYSTIINICRPIGNYSRCSYSCKVMIHTNIDFFFLLFNEVVLLYILCAENTHAYCL